MGTPTLTIVAISKRDFQSSILFLSLASEERVDALGSHFNVLLEGKLDHKQKRRENALIRMIGIRRLLCLFESSFQCGRVTEIAQASGRELVRKATWKRSCFFQVVSRKLGFSKGTRLLAFGNSLFSVEARVQGLTLLFHPATQGVLPSVRSSGSGFSV